VPGHAAAPNREVGRGLAAATAAATAAGSGFPWNCATTACRLTAPAVMALAIRPVWTTSVGDFASRTISANTGLTESQPHPGGAPHSSHGTDSTPAIRPPSLPRLRGYGTPGTAGPVPVGSSAASSLNSAASTAASTRA
jgi:hypothetical protein